MSFYDEVGGAATFERLVAAFYEGVAADEPLRALYPEADLGPAERRLRLFLEQYFGGPHAYGEERGHPRLRLRHIPYAVTLDMRDRWLAHMLGALERVRVEQPGVIDDAHAEAMRDYFARAADMLVNTAT